MIKTSANDILLYELCPRKWELSKMGVKGKKQNFAFYRFSSALHFAVNKAVSEMENIIEVFETYWGRYKEDYPLTYEGNDTWESLNVLGLRLLMQFQKEFPAKNISPILTEKRFRMITDEWEFTNQPDLVGFRDSTNRYVALDYKTTKEKIDEFWVHVSDQMTASAMLTEQEFMTSPPIDIIVCNFIRNTESIEWIESVRKREDIDAYKAKINHFVYLMYVNGYHPRRSLYSFDSPCHWCDFKEVCLQPDDVLKISLKEMSKSGIGDKR